MELHNSSSHIFKSLINRKIDLFLSTFLDEADTLFKIDDKLIHPGEYGMYRERSLQALLRILLPKRFNVNDGFVFNKENISTQCDIIINDSVMDSITSDGLAKYFPIQYVYAIGEVKSSLDKTTLKQAALKLANNKSLGRERVEQSKDYTAKLVDNVLPISFLVCKNIDGIEKIDETFWDDVYQGIDNEYRHNIILSIEDGFFAYRLSVNQVTGNGIEYIGMWPHPVINSQKLPNRFVQMNIEDKYYHLYSFFGVLIDSIKAIEQIDFPIMEYLDISNKEFEEYLTVKRSIQ